jgi:CheY-like chemotaxis protein
VPPPDESSRETTRRTDACRILIADDHPDVLESLAMLLEIQGHEVATARDGLEACEVAGHFRPDLVLLDLGMPKLDGFGACRRIREQPWGRNLTVIALSGWAQDSDRCKSQEAGFDDHLVKPVAPAALRAVIAKAQGLKA